MLSRETFAKHVGSMLPHLYDPVYLQNHPLGEMLVTTNATNHGIRAQMLRETIVEAIEQLQPDRRVPFGSKEWIAYRILNHRYLEAMTPKEVAGKLHISERHFFRQHRLAVEAVTAVLWDRYARRQEKRTESGDLAPLTDVVNAIGRAKLADSAARQMVEHSRRQRVDLARIADGLQKTLLPFAGRKGVDLQWDIAPEPIPLLIDPAVLRQIVLNASVGILERGESGSMRLEMHQQEDQALIAIEYTSARELTSAELNARGSLVALHLTESEGGTIQFSEQDAHTVRVLISLPMRKATVLVIDDNPDAIALLRRYLRGTEHRLVGVLDGKEGIRLAEVLKPDVIVLDVMMPSQDGWQVLQALRANAATERTPVVVSSVLDQAELALTMGADDLLQKPVSQHALLQILERWIHGPDSAATST